MQMKQVLYLTGACNNDCRFCSGGAGNFADLSLKDVHSITKRRGLTELNLFGGEPAMRKDFLEICRIACGSGIPVHLSTNLRRFSSRKFADAALRCGISTISTSVHGHNPQTHDFLTRKANSFRETMAGLDNVREHGIGLRTTTVITRHNLKHLPAIAEFLASEREIHTIQFAFPRIIGSVLDEPGMVPKYSETVPELAKAIDTVKTYGAAPGFSKIPCCMLPEYSEYRIDPPGYDKNTVYSLTNNAHAKREDLAGRNAGKLLSCKSAACASCSFNGKCEGFQRAYVGLYGWKELAPAG